jgi:hypothetical protein
MINIVDMAIQVGRAKEDHSFVSKVKHLKFGKLSLLHVTDPVVKKYVHYQTNQILL